MTTTCIRALAITFLAFKLAGCASPVVERSAYQGLGNPIADSAKIFVYREDSFAGIANQYDVLMDGTLVGSLPNGSFFTITSKPGSKHFKADTGMGKGSVVQVENNNIYCMKLTLNWNFLMKSANVEPIDKEQCKIEMNGLVETNLR